MALAAGLAACGSDEPEVAENPQRALFAERCAACHSFVAADSRGSKRGPDLDALHPSATVVRTAVEEGVDRGNGVMPAGLAKGQEAQDLAEWIAANAQTPPPEPVADTAAVAKDGVLYFPPADDGSLAYAHREAEAPAGGLTVHMSNASLIPHQLGVKGKAFDETGSIAATGQTSTVRVELELGEDYTIYCAIPGHEENGMQAKLTVR